MNLIGFSHHYTKMYGQTHGKLIYVDLVRIKQEDVNSDWWNYDTAYETAEGVPRIEFCDILRPNETYVRLVFLGNKNIPFTTYRECKDGHIPINPASIYWHENSPLSLKFPYKDLIGTEFVFKFRGEELPKDLDLNDKKFQTVIYN